MGLSHVEQIKLSCTREAQVGRARWAQKQTRVWVVRLLAAASWLGLKGFGSRVVSRDPPLKCPESAFCNFLGLPQKVAATALDIIKRPNKDLIFFCGFFLVTLALPDRVAPFLGQHSSLCTWHMADAQKVFVEWMNEWINDKINCSRDFALLSAGFWYLNSMISSPGWCCGRWFEKSRGPASQSWRLVNYDHPWWWSTPEAASAMDSMEDLGNGELLPIWRHKSSRNTQETQLSSRYFPSPKLSADHPSPSSVLWRSMTWEFSYGCRPVKANGIRHGMDLLTLFQCFREHYIWLI